MNISIEMSKINEKRNIRQTRLARFFGLIFLISIPLWIISALTAQFIPEGMPINNIGFILVFAPGSVALILINKDYGKKAAKSLLKKAFDYKRIEHKVWYFPTIFLLPIISFITLGLMMLFGFQFLDTSISFIMLPILFIVFIIFAIAEQVGWQGYAFDTMEAKWNTLNAAIILGIIWAVWHIPLYIIQEPLGGFLSITGKCIYTAVLRIFIVLIYKKTNRSVFTAVLIHAISNLCTMVLPIFSIPLGSLLVSGMMIITLTVVIGLWGF